MDSYPSRSLMKNKIKYTALRNSANNITIINLNYFKCGQL